MIASKEKRSIFGSVYFVSPALRASRRNVTAVWVKPTHTVIPRRKRLRSGIASRASSAGRPISRKSPDSGTRSICAMRRNDL